MCLQYKSFENTVGKGEIARNLNPFPNNTWFLCVCSTSLLKTLWEKEKLLVTSNFSFSHSVFYMFGEFFAIMIKIETVIWKSFSLKFDVWERIYQSPYKPDFKQLSGRKKLHKWYPKFLPSPLTHYQMTNFRLFQTESLQMTISNLTKMAESYPNG